MTSTLAYRERVLHEIEALPDEYLPFVLQLVQTFRASITLKSASASLQQGWHEAQTGDLTPLADLWEDVDVT